VCRVAQYDLAAMRTLDEGMLSQLDLSEEATAVAMKRLSMWQSDADAEGSDAERSDLQSSTRPCVRLCYSFT
jgi:hypothetical protein